MDATNQMLTSMLANLQDRQARERAARAAAETPKADKGLYAGSCNRTACQRPGATRFNTGTKAYYCDACAQAINHACRDQAASLGLICLPAGEVHNPGDYTATMAAAKKAAINPRATLAEIFGRPVDPIAEVYNEAYAAIGARG